MFGIILVILIIVAILDERNKARRMEREYAREETRFRLRLMRESEEVEAMCAGKSHEERARIHGEYCARLGEECKRLEARIRERERQRQAEEHMEKANREMSPGTKGALLFMAGAAVGSMGRKRGGVGISGLRDRSYGDEYSGEDCLEEQHEDGHDD